MKVNLTSEEMAIVTDAIRMAAFVYEKNKAAPVGKSHAPYYKAMLKLATRLEDEQRDSA